MKKAEESKMKAMRAVGLRPVKNVWNAAQGRSLSGASNVHSAAFIAVSSTQSSEGGFGQVSIDSPLCLNYPSNGYMDTAGKAQRLLGSCYCGDWCDGIGGRCGSL